MEEAAKLASPIFERAGAHVTVRQRFGNPAEEILEEIAEWKPDLGRNRTTGFGHPPAMDVGQRLGPGHEAREGPGAGRFLSGRSNGRVVIQHAAARW